MFFGFVIVEHIRVKLRSAAIDKIVGFGFDQGDGGSDLLERQGVVGIDPVGWNVVGGPVDRNWEDDVRRFRFDDSDFQEWVVASVDVVVVAFGVEIDN